MRRMFSGAVLFDQAIGSWDVSKVKNMAGMFADALRFNQPLNQWETDSLQYIYAIFSNAELFNQSLNNWDVSKVADMSRVFKNASSFDQDLSSWNIERVGTSDEDEDYSMEDMLSNSGMSIANYDATLTGWSIQNVDDDVRLGATGLEFCDGASARQILIDDFGWEILGDFECGMLPPCESVTSNEYIGAVVGDWDVDANWSLGRVPEHCDDVIIAGDNNSVISVTVSTDASCAFLEIELGVSFEITNGAVFEVKAPQIDIEEGEQ